MSLARRSGSGKNSKKNWVVVYGLLIIPTALAPFKTNICDFSVLYLCPKNFGLKNSIPYLDLTLNQYLPQFSSLVQTNVEGNAFHGFY